MFRASGKYTVLEFGYEKIIPELVQYGHSNSESSGVIDTLRTAPDFAIISKETKLVHLVEVKYRHAMNNLEIKKCAEKMHESWNPSYLFVASQDGFYMDEIGTIIDNNGVVSELMESIITKSDQEQYLKVIKDFED